MSGFLPAIAGFVADSGEYVAGDAPFTHSLGSGQAAGALAPADADREQNESAEDSAAEKDGDRDNEKRHVNAGNVLSWWCLQMATARYSMGPNERAAT